MKITHTRFIKATELKVGDFVRCGKYVGDAGWIEVVKIGEPFMIQEFGGLQLYVQTKINENTTMGSYYRMDREVEIGIEKP